MKQVQETKSTHTQGEWQLHYFGDNGNRQCRIHSNNVTIAKVLQIDEADANAKLIAAAPDLLEALHQVMEELNQQMRKQNRLTFTKAELIAQEAINKATL
jgi:hypothetical protein